MIEMRPEPYKECLSLGNKLKRLAWNISALMLFKPFAAILEMAKYCLSMLGGQDRQRLKSECFG